ncbi:tyrosine-type recombinase/integrase [Hellea balneolensis]|uniref:tyrosine-type recombinase/integrase n=1 Tax=Hellea balneolensis TaxID=287478 RepID=UPI0006862FAE|nr:tyrosine-type recombinase/integrase [Hellea balneolensis]
MSLKSEHPVNAGKKLALSKDETVEIQKMLMRQSRWRDLALFMLGIDSLLRVSDLLKLRVRDVADPNGRVQAQFHLTQTKTKRSVEIYLTRPTQQAVQHWIDTSEKLESDYLFTRLRRRGSHNAPISDIMLRLLIKGWVEAIGLDPKRYSSKTLRKTRVRAILEMANYDYAVVQKLLGHSNLQSTIHYVDLAQDTARDCAERVQYFEPLNLKFDRNSKIGSVNGT